MSTYARKSGQAKIGLVLLIIAVVIGVLYFTSDVFKTKINVAADQYAHWTPENIAKDPENYLNFCEQEANAAIQKLKASQIAVAQNHANLEAMQAEATEKIAAGNKALDDLKTIYREASTNNTWPVSYRNASRDQDWVKRQIVSLSRQLASQESLKSKTGAGIKQLDLQATKIQEANSRAQEQVSEIKTSRETLKVQKITADLSQQLANISSTLRATISTASESTGTITLDQLQAESATAVDDSEFNKIMGK